ncbi:regulator of G protein signaling domain protein [Rhizoctonia solani AG-3 Rhs1AP]|uniref:Regulator of G protein signaling domain protein n=1 Tax=Rhizoctonia solani AG-3 Rhs1AP TaxID=1086054 RepID=A0A0A1UK39_9AGAM|nr:regulator of G protein signaling domain protein [Rhizoctonia solani AG-3 Rhs1AP]
MRDVSSSPPLAPYSPLAMPQRPKRRRRPVEERPPPHWFTLGSLRRAAHRMRHPPPQASEEHYKWFLAPRFNVPLQDVIEDKHLAPLSRQDFEDFLQYADGTIENLYFYDWVRNYRRLYREWAESVLPNAGTHMSSSSKGVYRSRDLWEQLKDCQDRRLKEEFASAKALFFERGAPCRLDIDQELIDKVLNIPNHPPRHGQHQDLTDKLPSFPNQPEPSIFDSIQHQVDTAVEEAFVRFRRLAFCNSGLWHSCVGYSGGAVILACGLALYCLGIMSLKRKYVGGSLPIIWFGLWFMLVSINNHCLVVYITGDARQLYPHEMARPLPPDTVPPPVYSLALASNGEESPYSFSWKTSTTSNLLPSVHAPTLPRPSYHPLSHLNSQRTSEPITKCCPPHTEWQAQPQHTEFQLPPPRRTKNLPRTSLAADVGQANGLDPRVSVDYATRHKAVVEWPVEEEQGEEDRMESPVFTEENDFGIVISEAYEADEPGPFLFPACAEDRPAPVHSFAAHEEEAPPVQPHFISGTCPEPLAPLVQVPEYAAQRRRTVLDLFAPECSASRRGSKASDVERVMRKQWPWPRSFLGPMTLVHSPLVRRAHWVVTTRSAIVASVLTCGLAIGLVH